MRNDNISAFLVIYCKMCLWLIFGSFCFENRHLGSYETGHLGDFPMEIDQKNEKFRFCTSFRNFCVLNYNYARMKIICRQYRSYQKILSCDFSYLSLSYVRVLFYEFNCD